MRPAPGKKAIFRFYEELNDFIPARERKRDRVYIFNGNPSVKDAIEAQNVPHTEVDLVLINGHPASFSHRLHDGDRVSVYPVFESFDIGAVKKDPAGPARQSRFILDVHLGKLAKLLRMSGFDTCYRNDLDDDEIIDRGEKENRIIITRDIGILKNNWVQKGYYVRSQNPREQLKEVIIRFQLQSSIRFLSRCMECNGLITKTEKKEVEKDLNTGTRNYFEKFFRCSNCRKIYWEGSHFERMQAFLRDLRESLDID